MPLANKLWALPLSSKQQVLIFIARVYHLILSLYAHFTMGDEKEYRAKIERLDSDGSNWVSYKARLQSAFLSHEWEEHLTETTVTASYINLGNVNNITPDRRWTLDERAARQWIVSSIPNTIFLPIMGNATVKGLWDALVLEFEGRSTTAIADLEHQINTTYCGDNENVRDHIEKLALMRERLASLGDTMTDRKYGQILIGSMPSMYSHVRASIASAALISHNPASSTDIAKLIIDEYESRLLGKKAEDTTALSAETQKKDKKGKKNMECFNCHKKGHSKAECWASGGGNEGGGPKQKGKKNRNGKDKSGKKAEVAAANDSQSDIEAWAVIMQDVEGLPVMAVQESDTCELFDSGASRHMSPFRKSFITYREIEARPITAANKNVFHAIGIGDVIIKVPNGATSSTILLRDVLHAPDLALTVVSIGRIVQAGYSVEFNQDNCIIRKRDGSTIGRIPAGSNGLFKLDHAFAAITSDKSVDIHALHRQLGHISLDAIRALIRSNAITGINLIDNSISSLCDSCEHAKMTRKAIRKEREAPPAQAFGEEIHTDVWGPSPNLSLGKRRYYLTFTDDYSRFTKVDILRTKDETFAAYKNFAAWAQTQHGAQIKRLRSDRGGEFTSHEFTKYLQKEGTERRLTTADTPQHNGIAESLNRRLLERVRAMLHQSRLPKNLWAEAVQHAVWIKNRTSTKALGNITPFERLYGEKPNLSDLHEWGQDVWIHDSTGSKLDARAKQARWIGYDADSTHAHRIYWPGKNRVTVERNVKFKSSTITVTAPRRATVAAQSAPQPAAAVQAPAAPAPAVVPAAAPAAQTIPVQPPPLFQLIPTTITPSTTSSLTPVPTTPTHSDEEVEDNILPWGATMPGGASPEQLPRRSGRSSKPSLKARLIQEGEAEGNEVVDYAMFADLGDIISSAIADVDKDPQTLAEARSRSDWPKWREAMDREIATLQAAGTWIDVPRPSDKNVVGSKWVFRIKRKADGSIDKYKARLVARGFTQIYGVDYFSTYSPVAKLTSFRTILAIAAHHDWEIESFDFNGAYLNGELDAKEQIFMQAPPGYESDPRVVKRLLKSLYGLKQAGRRWYETLTRALKSLGFRASVADPGVFIARASGQILILAVHVDDCVLTGSSSDQIAQYKQKLNSCYALTDLGPVHWLLGIKVTRDRAAHTISLSQGAYIDAILSRFALSDAKSYGTPMTPGVIYSKKDAPTNPDEYVRMKKTPYREAIGSLMYAAVATRPDIAFAVSILSQFLDNPGTLHWEATKRVFRYLAGTKNYQLMYGGERHDLEGYTDADGAMQEHRHAISGYAFLFDGGAISWSSKKQELVTLSTAEAEFVAATHAAKEALWLRKLLGDIYPGPKPPTPFHCDNQAALSLIKDDNYHARTKHLDVHFYFIRETAQRGAIKLLYCPTEDMVADLLTKALPKWKVNMHTSSLGLRRACGGVL